MLRQHQIDQQKKEMIDRETRRMNDLDTVSHDGKSQVHINPNINRIIDEKIHDDHSKIDDMSNYSFNGSFDGFRQF